MTEPCGMTSEEKERLVTVEQTVKYQAEKIEDTHKKVTDLHTAFYMNGFRGEVAENTRFRKVQEKKEALSSNRKYDWWKWIIRLGFSAVLLKYVVVIIDDVMKYFIH